MQAAAESCAAAIDVTSLEALWPLGGAPDGAGGAGGRGGAGGDKQRWLQVLADAGLTDEQMRELGRLRGALLEALGRVLAERRLVAERIALGERAPASWPSS